MEKSIEQKQDIFVKKSILMKESHVVTLEVYIDKLCFNDESTKEINENSDIVKIRVKFANLPCMEIKGTFQKENLELEAASVGTLRATSLQDISEREFFRQGRMSLVSSLIMKEKLKKAKQDRLRRNKERDKNAKLFPQSKNKTLSQKRGDLRSGKESSGGKSDNEDSGRERGDSDKEGDSTISANSCCGVLFNDCKAMIFAITPQELLYHLINKPLKLFLIYYFGKNSVELIGEATISLYQLSDIVPHMVLMEGGVHSVSKMEGIFPIFTTDLRDCSKAEIGRVKLKFLLASYGVTSCAKFNVLGRISNVKFMTDELVENLEQGHLLPQIVRDTSHRLPIVTGAEHVIVPDKISSLPLQTDSQGASFKCVNKWEDILEA